ncbi:Sphingomyelin phosphodiesterase [Entamoeba marina]
MSLSNQQIVKVLLLGDTNVGKTSITLRFIDDIFDTIYLSSVGVDFKFKTITRNGKNVKLQIWDSAGQERFHSISRSYYRGADYAIVVFDVTNENSFQRAKYWLDDIATEKIKGQQILVGNKTDLIKERTVTTEEIEEQFPEVKYFEVSAKTGENVKELFDSIVDLYLQNKSDNTQKDIIVHTHDPIVDIQETPTTTITHHSGCHC